MTQNIYDREEFFVGYSQMRRSLEGLDGAPEWSSFRALLPPLHGGSVVDLGCGFGWFCRWAREHGAGRVLGIDISEKMLTRAEVMTSDANITYQRADLESLDLAQASFDLVYSSLAFHYVVDLPRLFRTIHGALVSGGRLVFSIEHPIYMAPTHPEWLLDRDGRKTWPLNQYLMEGPRTTDWLAKGVLKQHRMMGTTLNLLLQAGFTLSHVEEWRPTDEQIASRPELAEELERPMFLLVAAQR
ncbi:class I SAM-dependent methyltransferase [Edaphobacter albus]|uniref:class I SAM-dependent methyltransferase n=1 Tax=Edaphobacter sp. 4G125 TaxID=2763071 RepID=UPI00164674D3|nr:class I SAM-dependent methyltransferase [Edaphobacter sp. 4G125]QNI37022.1 class I SAM-dependent methyltransferase [Edaphobacter sp. 4G125]